MSIPAPQNKTVSFNIGEDQVGVFDFGASPMTFTGDVDSSAKIFVDTILKMMVSANCKSNQAES